MAMISEDNEKLDELSAKNFKKKLKEKLKINFNQ